ITLQITIVPAAHYFDWQSRNIFRDLGIDGGLAASAGTWLRRVRKGKIKWAHAAKPCPPRMRRYEWAPKRRLRDRRSQFRTSRLVPQGRKCRRCNNLGNFLSLQEVTSGSVPCPSSTQTVAALVAPSSRVPCFGFVGILKLAAIDVSY